jgi:flagellar biosynthesis GTPase FlhF
MKIGFKPVTFGRIATPEEKKQVEADVQNHLGVSDPIDFVSIIDNEKPYEHSQEQKDDISEMKKLENEALRRHEAAKKAGKVVPSIYWRNALIVKNPTNVAPPQVLHPQEQFSAPETISRVQQAYYQKTPEDPIQIVLLHEMEDATLKNQPSAQTNAANPTPSDTLDPKVS